MVQSGVALASCRRRSGPHRSQHREMAMQGTEAMMALTVRGDESLDEAQPVEPRREPLVGPCRRCGAGSGGMATPPPDHVLLPRRRRALYRG
uniref:Uncharacterized protein n=1 Tax=Arundo donax TaxID=35708 RepID=A0A0A9AZ25_ARUDO